jgi:hypothetical protein
MVVEYEGTKLPPSGKVTNMKQLRVMGANNRLFYTWRERERKKERMKKRKRERERERGWHVSRAARCA